jgi:hypothetical protein
MMWALALTIATNAWAYRVIEQLEDAYELFLDEIELPGSIAGSVSFKPCNLCDAMSMTVTAATRYYTNGTLLALDDFRDVANAIRKVPGHEENTVITVFFDLNSMRVNRLEIDQI